MEEKTKLPHFRELDGVRGFAALGVFIHHFLKASVDQRTGEWPLPVKRVVDALTYGGFGVDVFFVLSGFLITSLLLIQRDKTEYFHNFYWKRALRILPVYFVHLILTQIILGDAWGYILLALLFLVNFANRFNVAAKGVAWSLSIEEQFYLIWPHCVRRLKLSSLYYVAFGIVAVCDVLRIVIALRKGGVPIAYTFYRCDGLGLGAILACQWFSAGGRTRFVRGMIAVLNSKVTLALAIVAELGIVSFGHHSALADVLTITFINYAAYRLIHHIVFHPGRGTGWLGGAVPVFFGSISYGLYMYHGFVMVLFDRYFGVIDPMRFGATLGRFVLMLSISVAVCVISLYGMEIPVQRLRGFVLRPSVPQAKRR